MNTKIYQCINVITWKTKHEILATKIQFIKSSLSNVSGGIPLRHYMCYMAARFYAYMWHKIKRKGKCTAMQLKRLCCVLNDFY